MNCLSREEIQEYVDMEMDALKRISVIKHLNSCEECGKLHKEQLDDIRFISESLNILEISPDEIPSIEKYVKNRLKHRFVISDILKAVAAIFVITISVSLSIIYFGSSENKPNNDWMVNNVNEYSDPNKQWHDNQMIITLLDNNNELVLSFNMDNTK
jgi:predicted anti-sigma-YlaC factor YlaD